MANDGKSVPYSAGDRSEHVAIFGFIAQSCRSGGGFAHSDHWFGASGLVGVFFDDSGFPVASGWDTLDFPNLGDINAYALEICGESMEPVYRKGDVVIVSPNSAVLPADCVVVKNREGEILAKQLIKRTIRELRLASINRTHGDLVIPRRDIEWISRIVWVSH